MISADPFALPRFEIESIQGRRILNSYAQWTNEFTVRLKGGVTGRGSSSWGETLSIHEKSTGYEVPAEKVLEKIMPNLNLAEDTDQKSFDSVLQDQRAVLGQGNVYALSLAFFYASAKALGICSHELLSLYRDRRAAKPERAPRLLFNILNGGRYARTNPVLSDFSEFLLVPREGDLEFNLEKFHAINRRVREQLAGLATSSVNGNPVRELGSNSNRAWIEFILSALDKEKLSGVFGLMIDASAGHLVEDGRYRLSFASGGGLSADRLGEYWADLLSTYPIDILEDPFAEDDKDSWALLTAAFPDRLIAGDNLCATDAGRILEAIDAGLMSAVLVKPDQAGSVSAALAALDTACAGGIPVIPSHRSIETGHTFLSDICAEYRVEYAKLGLVSDFETIIKLNRLIRIMDGCAD